jgi:excisionase family DNA binding protein
MMGAYLSARESADYCGVSEKTIRNWIAAGKLSAEKSAGTFRIAQDDLDTLRSGSPHPPRQVESASAEVRAEGSPHRAESAETTGIVELVMLVRALQEQLIARTEAAAMWQERAGSLSDRLVLAEGKLAALEAPQQPQEVILAASTAPQTVDPPTEPDPEPDPFPAPLPPRPNVRRWWPDQGPFRAVLGSIGLAVLLLIVWWLGH